MVVFDSGVPRNVASPAVQGFLSRDGTPPAELKRVSREQIEKYGTVGFREVRVNAIEPPGEDGSFGVRTDDGEPIEATLVLLATGMIDVYPDIEGFSEHWGHRIIHCLLPRLG